MHTSFFDTESAKIVTLPEWMAWASNQADVAHRVVLPMIQRGSVWAPHKILDLWDTLLRGMPMGALMARNSPQGSTVKILGEIQTRESAEGDIDLIDGQQRTLAIMAGWPPSGLKDSMRPVVIWLDLIDAPQEEYIFRLLVTTTSQPFGYARATRGGNAISKLEHSKLRVANAIWKPEEIKDEKALWKSPDFMPWDANFSVPITELMENSNELSNFLTSRLDSYRSALNQKIDAIKSSKNTEANPNSDAAIKYLESKYNSLPSAEEIIKRIPTIQAALQNINTCQLPILRVREDILNDKEPQDDDENSNVDPPLAILFKRVGTSGETLSDADYIYSIIKHHMKEAHETIETLLEDPRTSAIYTPTTLAMTAVRWTLLSQDNKESKIRDSARMDKTSFARLIHKHPGFINNLRDEILPSGSFQPTLENILKAISYDKDFRIGLPKHALSLIPIPLLEVILAWHKLKNPSDEAIKNYRHSLVRFILQGHLCIYDFASASEVAIEFLKKNMSSSDNEIFPDQALMMELESEKQKHLALPLPSPDALQSIHGLTLSPDEVRGIRGWTRFDTKNLNDLEKQYVTFYNRWWNRNRRHIHPILLWLQRDYVFKNFEEQPALPGLGDETPFDYDHILPRSQWSYWTGASSGNRLMDFRAKDNSGNVDQTGHWSIGDSIGNIHILSSQENRSFGDTPVKIKFGKPGFRDNSLIEDEFEMLWLSAGGEDEKPRWWDIHRALDFQKAVETRAFDLYSKFYTDLFIHQLPLNTSNRQNT